MKIRVLCLLGLLAAAAQAAPVNDNFANAKLIYGPVGILASENNAGATAEYGEPAIGSSPAQRTLWYRIVAPPGGLFVAEVPDTLGIRMTLFRSSADGSVESLSPVASTTNAQPGDTERLSSYLAFGSKLYLGVDAESVGPFSLRYHIGGTENDFFADATILPGDQGTVSANTSRATLEEGEPTPPAGNKQSVWFKWLAPATGSYTFDTLNSSFDTVLGVFTGTSVSSLTLVGENDDDAPGMPAPASRVSISATAGTTYYIRVTGVSVAKYPSNQSPPGAGNVWLNYYPSSNKGQFSIDTPAGNTVGEGGKITVSIRREFGSSGAASVQVTTQDIAAVSSGPGTDYLAVNQTLTFSDGQVERLLDITTIADAATEGPENFGVTLSNPSPNPGTTLHIPTIGIFIEEVPTASVAFAHFYTVAREGQGVAQIELVRTGNPATPLVLPISFSSSSPSVRPGTDFVQSSTYVQFFAWQMTATVGVDLPDDTEIEGVEDVQMLIGNSTGVLRIMDNDIVPAQAATFEAAQLNASALGGYLFRATLTPNGMMTGQIKTRSTTLSFKGAVSPSGELVALVPRANGLGDLQVRLQCQDGMKSAHVQILSSLGDVNEQFNVPRAFASGASKVVSPQAGAYTLKTSQTTISGAELPAPFYCTFTISPTGAVKGVGKLADGQTVSFASQQELTGRIHAFVPMRRGRELFAISADYNPTVGKWDFTGSMIWQKLPSKGDRLLPTGIPQSGLFFQAIRYNPPAAGHRALEVWEQSNGGASFAASGTGFGFDLPTVGMTISTANAATFATPGVSLKVNAKTGMFTGTIKPSGHAPVPFGGVLYQGTGVNSLGFGSFLADGLAGGVTLSGP
ncbi:Calx-beta domain-containing protein [Verrucomicrobiota bacterium sgz303538]